ncbi:hypothetical protein TSUD_240600 [Trifolium subterraneum]|uniref:TF-B3 domain-containing protein n=1 Tax=Trifolium subterraneum TaxID=3900 RepID=A0A2Z6PIV7_TRISU|nr:hypothetical protein TSUD_240600 [Trifolium subterraneum]
MKRSEKKKAVSKTVSQDRRKHKKKPMETKPVSVIEELSSESEEKSLDFDCFKIPQMLFDYLDHLSDFLEKLPSEDCATLLPFPLSDFPIEQHTQMKAYQFVFDQSRRPAQLHRDVRPYAMMTRTCYLEFDPLKDCKRNQIQVSVERKNDKIYFVQGWYRLKDFYGIHLGGWLTILYISPTIFHIRVRKNTGIEVQYPDQTPPQRILLNTPFGEGPSNGPIPLFASAAVFSHRLEKTLTSSDVESGTLCHLRVGNSPHITCQISGQWRDICKARRLVVGVVVKFGVTLPSNNKMLYFKISPFIGVRTTMIGPTRDGRRKPFYQTEHYFML